MAIPAEAKCFTYTPECLAGIEGAPVFTLRYGTRRDRHTYQDELMRQNVPAHSDKQDYREAYLDAIRHEFKIDTISIDEVIDTVERYYSAADALDADNEEWLKMAREILSDVPAAERDKPENIAKLPPRPELEFDRAERIKVEKLLNDVAEHSPSIGTMNMLATRRERKVKRIGVAVMLQSSTLDIPLTRDMDGVISADTIDALEDELEKFSESVAPDAPAWTAFDQLCNKSLQSFYLTEAEEKNFASPPLTTSDQNCLIASPETDTPSRSGTKASAKSPDTLEASSEPATPA